MIKHKSAAFTLIEVLVALLIIAIALGAAVRSVNESVRVTTHVRDSVGAHWVGLNILSQIQTGMIAAPTPSNIAHGQVKMMNQEWQWTAQAKPSQQSAHITRILVTIELKKHVVNEVVGFMLNAKETRA
ncbi:MAG: type II secretion system protein GspI [Gammaproteobacteria bacterium RIFCSPHIGHO2_12_FULL_40_19]|nr:MAG: type II secretion system protein GspI [Gammaproteobacteria bacterium RIFCSPHIGHO2_12_FULL_40_19]